MCFLGKRIPTVKRQDSLKPVLIVLSPVGQRKLPLPVISLCQPDNEVTAAAAPDTFISLSVDLSGFTNTMADSHNTWWERQGILSLLNQLICFAQGQKWIGPWLHVFLSLPSFRPKLLWHLEFFQLEGTETSERVSLIRILWVHITGNLQVEQAPGALQLILEEENLGKKRESEGAERGKECKRI